ncbi:MAG: hypothetical protein K2X35_23495 [Bryobacteraceae bacterium]|nr:hypothetical protein [Bryobacteraceae bacterium]
MTKIARSLSLLALIPAVVSSQGSFRGRVRVTFGEPNLWSLEQAQHLLEQRFADNSHLKPTEPSADQLNPNAIHGTRFDALKQALSARVGLDQQIQFQNQLAMPRIQEDALRRNARLAELTTAQQQELEIKRKLATAEARKAPLEKELALLQTRFDAASEENRPALMERIVRLSERLAKLSEEIGVLTAEKSAAESQVALLKKVLEDAVDPTTLSTVSPPGMPSAATTGLLENALSSKFNPAAPKQSFTNTIDNYLTAQNEAVMKNVTLLRNDPPFQRRVVFAELPHSFHVAGLAKNEIARVIWTLKGFTRKVRRAQEQSDYEYDLERRRETVLCGEAAEREVGRPILCQPAPGGERGRRLPGGSYFRNYEIRPPSLTDFLFYTLPETYFQFVREPRQPGSTMQTRRITRETVAPGTVRTLDLVPAQSSLNVNQENYVSREISLAGLLKWMVPGLGAQIDYHRQRQAYEEFLQSALFASAFGKGEAKFGWTFAPNPGTTSISPGVKTTYAVFEVPESAITLHLSASFCTYPSGNRRESEICQQSNAQTEHFVLPIPARQQYGFYVTEISYHPVEPGQRQVVRLLGEHFSRLTGVLVAGVPLKRSINITAAEVKTERRLELRADSRAIEGEYEILNSREMVLAFRMPPTFVGTPSIIISSPARSRDLLTLENPAFLIRVSGGTRESSFQRSLRARNDMFVGSQPAIHSVDLFCRPGPDCDIVIEGANLPPNGWEVPGIVAHTVPGPKPTRVCLRVKSSDLLSAKELPIHLNSRLMKTVDGLRLPVITGVTLIHLASDPRDRHVLKLEGNHFTRNLHLKIDDCADGVSSLEGKLSFVNESLLLATVPVNCKKFAVLHLSDGIPDTFNHTAAAVLLKEPDSPAPKKDELRVKKVVTTAVPK